MAVDKAFELGMHGVYHDEASVTATGYTYSLWDNHTAMLDPITKAVVGLPGAIALIRRFHKVKLMERIVGQHGGVLLMNGGELVSCACLPPMESSVCLPAACLPVALVSLRLRAQLADATALLTAPITRTFREAALRASPGSVVSFVEGENINGMLWTHLFTSVGQTREAGRNYSPDLDWRYNATGIACQNESNAEKQPASCLGRSLVDLLDSGTLPLINGRMFINGTFSGVISLHIYIYM
jgi:hypothetical protein